MLDPESVFSQVFDALPRQGPGSTEDTLAALAHARDGFAPLNSILDVGCGSGAQSLALLRNSQAHLTALDLSPSLLARLQTAAEEEGFVSRLTTVQASMKEMPFASDSFDLIWSEGAVYIIGFENALESFRSHLRPGGRIAVSDIAWLVENPPREAREWMASEGVVALHDDEKRAAFVRQGYRLLNAFVVSAAGWWDHYLDPLSARVTEVRADQTDRAALSILDELDQEVAMHQAHLGTYGYVFYIAERTEQ